jgi:hypothetical protein
LQGGLALAAKLGDPNRISPIATGDFLGSEERSATAVQDHTAQVMSIFPTERFALWRRQS